VIKFSQKELLLERGYTNVVRIFEPSELIKIQEQIYSIVSPFLKSPERDNCSLEEKLSMPMRSDVDKDTLRALQRQYNPLVAEAFHPSSHLQGEKYGSKFNEIFGEIDFEPSPIANFRCRSNFPYIGRGYGWHQDSGTWSISPGEDWKKSVITLWVALTTCNSENSLELLPGSHKFGLSNSYRKGGKSFLNSAFIPEVRTIKSESFAFASGEGIFFHPLVYHQTKYGNFSQIRVSIDLRFYSPSFPGDIQLSEVSYKVLFKRKVMEIPVVGTITKAIIRRLGIPW